MPRSLVRSPLAVPLLVLLGIAPASAQTWTKRTPTTAPPARNSHAIAYDWQRSRAVMFGGRDTTQTDQSDTWEWDGTTWTKATPAASPPARWYHAMAYDVSRQRVVLFGGGTGTSGRLADTWEWDGTSWTQRMPATSPVGRYRHVMDYDVVRSKVVMFGGTTGIGTTGVLNDTWEWDGSNWTKLSPAASPKGRISATLTYDLARNRSILYGGYDGSTTGVFADTWSWDGTNWTQLAPLTVPIERFSHSAAFDRVRGRIVVYGGRNYRTVTDLADTWEWDGSDWLQTTPPAGPPARYLTVMAYDLPRLQMVLYGGTPGVDETWTYDANGYYATFGRGCAGTVGVPALARDQVPVVNKPFSVKLAGCPANAPGVVFLGTSKTSWSGLPLPLDLTFVGMPQCLLLTDGPVTGGFNAGAAGTATWGFAMPNNASLAGASFFNQAFVIDPTANTMGLVASNAGQGVVGV